MRRARLNTQADRRSVALRSMAALLAFWLGFGIAWPALSAVQASAASFCTMECSAKSEACCCLLIARSERSPRHHDAGPGFHAKVDTSKSRSCPGAVRDSTSKVAPVEPPALDSVSVPTSSPNLGTLCGALPATPTADPGLLPRPPPISLV